MAADAPALAVKKLSYSPTTGAHPTGVGVACLNEIPSPTTVAGGLAVVATVTLNTLPRHYFPVTSRRG